MMLRPGDIRGNAIAVFPFLKTSQPIRLGNFNFRSTGDIDGIGAEDATHVTEIGKMLFLQDDLRIESASYAMLPPTDLDKEDLVMQELQSIQAVVAYCYGSPSPAFSSPFLGFEQASLAIFSPEKVSKFMVRPEHHVVDISGEPKLVGDKFYQVDGYYGRYNFRHPFWAIRGSRLYPGVPHVTLNIGQDLANDFNDIFSSRKFGLLPGLFAGPATGMAERALSALVWYNRSNSLRSDDNSATLNLSVAFETLLALPIDAKTDRFVDAVSLLLGRVDRLDTWARQFYDARSAIVHRGSASDYHFMPLRQKGQVGPTCDPLLDYGRQIFQLCMSTLLFGAQLGSDAGLQERFIASQERIQAILVTLDDESFDCADRLVRIDDLVSQLEESRFRHETGLKIEALIGAAQRASKCLLQSSTALSPDLSQAAKSLACAKGPDREFDALAALEAINGLKVLEPIPYRSPLFVALRLASIVWHHSFWHYYQLKERRQNIQG